MRSQRSQGRANHGEPDQERPSQNLDEASASPLDQGWMQAFGEIGRSKGKNILALVAGIFSSKFPGLLEDLKKALQGNDSEAAEEAAHSLASISASVGALKLSERCSELEALLASGEQEEASDRLTKEVEIGFQEVQRALEKRLAQPDRDEA